MSVVAVICVSVWVGAIVGYFMGAAIAVGPDEIDNRRQHANASRRSF
jgi:F420-0:gamma-glutamyl ligase-like protein